MAIIQLDKASPASVHILLKALEDLPSCIKVILVSETLPLETVVSRTQMYSFGLLSDDAVAQVLIEKRKIEAGEAVRLAGLSGGQVYRALAALEVDDTLEVVLAVLAAFREKNPTALDRLASKWTDEATELLAVWCTEAITRQWRSFSPSEAVSGTSLPLKILLSLRTNIRPRLVVRSSLMSVLQGAS